MADACCWCGGSVRVGATCPCGHYHRRDCDPTDTAGSAGQDRVTDSAAGHPLGAPHDERECPTCADRIAAVRPEPDDTDERFRAIWLYCMIDHEVGTLPGGPCRECVKRYAVTGPPDGKWNR